MTQMPRLSYLFTWSRAASCCLLALLALPATAQTAPAAPTTTPATESIVLPTFTVSTSQDDGYRATNSVSATRVDTPIKDLPFSITAFTAQFIEDIGAHELLDVVNFAPGVTSGAKEFTQGNNRYSIRGFDGDVTPQRNGFRGSRYTDSATIDRVEVVKGPASLLYGQITPGGTVNYITKRPTNKNATKIKAEVGTDNFWRTDVDVNQVLIDGRVNGRFIGSYENSLAWANPSDGHAGVMAASFDVKLHENISVILDFENFHKVQDPLVGMSPNMAVPITATAANFPVLTDRARAQAYIDAGNLNLGFIGYPPLPRDFNYVGNGDYRSSDFNNFNAELNWKLTDRWRARANFGWEDFKISNKLTGLAEWTINPTAAYISTGKNRFDYVAELQANPAAVLADPNKTATAILTRRKRLEESGGDSRTYQAEIVGLIDIGGVKVKPLFGALLSQIGTNSFRRASNTTPPATTPNASTTGVQHFQPWQYNNPSGWDRTADYNPADLPLIESWNNTKGEESAVYALINASFLDERLIAIGGVRYNETWTQGMDFRVTPATTGNRYEADATTPQIGLGYKIRRDLMLFANYSESFYVEERSVTSWNPDYNGTTDTRVTVSDPAKPTTGSGYEVGIKTDFLEGRVSSTITLFHLERTDRILRFRQSAPDGTFPTLTSQGTVDQSEGAEFELTWSPTNNWQVYATYTTMNIETTKAQFVDNPIYSGSTDPAAQAAYKLAYAQAKDWILGAVPEGSAEQLASLWTRYNFSAGAMKGWWVAGGFVYTGDKAQRSANPLLFLPSSTIYDLTLGKNWNMGKTKWSTTLAWKNIADTEYWNANQSRGTPSRFVLSVTTRF